jgi:hypothetical protein
MKRAPHIPQEIAGLVDILVDRLVRDALAKQRHERAETSPPSAPVADEQHARAEAAKP